MSADEVHPRSPEVAADPGLAPDVLPEAQQRHQQPIVHSPIPCLPLQQPDLLPRPEDRLRYMVQVDAARLEEAFVLEVEGRQRQMHDVQQR